MPPKPQIVIDPVVVLKFAGLLVLKLLPAMVFLLLVLVFVKWLQGKGKRPGGRRNRPAARPRAR